MWEQNNSPGFGNGLPLILIRETLNKIYPQILQCDWDWFGSNDPGAGATGKRMERIYICTSVCVCVCVAELGVESVRSIHNSSPQLCFTLSRCLSLSSCRSLDSSCLSFTICPQLYFYLSLFSHFFSLLISLSLFLYPSLLSCSSILCYYSHAWLVSGLIWKQGISLLLMGHRDLITTCHHYQLSCLAFSIIFPLCMYQRSFPRLWYKRQRFGLPESPAVIAFNHTLKRLLNWNRLNNSLIFLDLFSSLVLPNYWNQIIYLLLDCWKIPQDMWERHCSQESSYLILFPFHIVKWNGIKTTNWQCTAKKWYYIIDCIQYYYAVKITFQIM